MIENSEFKILHLKAYRQAEDPALPVCNPFPPERSNTIKTAGRIPRISLRSQSIFQTSQNRTQVDLNRNFNPVKAEVKAAFTRNQRKSRNMGGRLLTCDARPHSPRIKFLSWKTVVGSGLLVRYAAHIAEISTTTSFNQTKEKTNKKIKVKTNNKNPRLQHFKHGIELFMYSLFFLETSFEKILIPGNIQIAGDIRRDA